MLRQKCNIENRLLLEQLIQIVFQRFVIRILNASIIQHHFAIGQCENAIAQPHDDLAIGPRHRLRQILRESTVTLDLGVHRWRYPDEAIVAQNDRCAAREIVKMGLAPFDQRWEHFDQYALRQLAVFQTSGVKRQAAIDEYVLHFG